MIQLYSKGTTDFSLAGISLPASSAKITWQENGRYDMDLSISKDVCPVTFDYGQILRAPVPVQKVGEITLGTVAYWRVRAGLTDVQLVKTVPVQQRISYKQWQYGQGYSVGNRVSYRGRNYQCTANVEDVATFSPPDAMPNHWRVIASSMTTGGEVITQLSGGTTVMKIQDFNSEWMEVATTSGLQGYIETAKCQDMGETETRTLPAMTIEEQSFVITEIEKTQKDRMITVHAEHISYALRRVILGDCKIVRVNPATALMLMQGAMKDSYPGEIRTNITDAEIDADWSWINAQAAILDPKSGLLQATGGQLIRDDLNIYLLQRWEAVPRYQVRYGVNMRGINWSGDVSEMVTRIYPLALAEDGSTLLLPEEYIETVRDIPFTRSQRLDTKLKVGTEEKQSDGTTITLDVDTVYARMREAANNRLNIDECDKPVVTLEIDWLHIPDTEEYKQYAALINAAPGEWVGVKNGPLGIDTTIQLTGYTWDAIRKRYQKTTFGTIKVSSGVASYDLQAGAVTARALANGSVGSGAIQAQSITAREIEAGSITADKIASRSISTELLMARAITANEIAAGTITAEQIASNTITAQQIAAGTIAADQLAAGAVTANKLDAGAVTAVKIAAGAVTTEKLDAGAVTADKIGAGAINADKLSTTDISAINAKLGIADIASAQIAVADINYLQVKDLTAGSAYFGQAIIQEGLANKLFIPRLSVVYAQMVSATVGDLVIQATNDNFYKLDVDLAGNVTATQVTPSAQEIEDGHTTDGRTIYLGTDIVAEDLNTTNIYASHALMDEITANIINVDQLFAREATIAKINAMDLSSNTYIRSTIGNWASGSTITQTINSLDSRISSLGYGTVYFQETEPSHSELVQGDIWVQSMPQGTWQSVSEDYASWQAIKDSVGTWQTLGGIPKMYVWDGGFWQEMYDANLPATLQTQIEQLSNQIALRATTSQVDALGNEIDLFSAELTVQSEQIQAAVSAVDTKASSYVMWADPRTVYTVSVGDIWVKCDVITATWSAVSNNFASWQEVKDTYETWERLLGAVTYVWNGEQWVETSDRASEISQQTQITQTAKDVTILATQQATFQESLVSLSASLTVAADRITAEVSRATVAESSKLDKTTQYQTADAIVSEAVRQASSSASGTYIAKTSVYQTAQSIVAAAEEYTTNNAYTIKSGIAINASGIEVSGGKYVKIKSGGSFSVDSGNFSIDSSGNVSMTGAITAVSGRIGGWLLGTNLLSSGSGSGYVALDSNASDTYAIWAGSATAANAPFRVARNGTVVLTALQVMQEDGTTTTVNLSSNQSSYPLWKLYYSTIRSYTTSGNYCTSMTLSNGATVNFNHAGVRSVELPATASANTTNKTLFAMATITLTNGVTDTRRIELKDPDEGLYYSGADSVQPTSWGISYTAGGANVSVLLSNGKTYTHFFAD